MDSLNAQCPQPLSRGALTLTLRTLAFAQKATWSTGDYPYCIPRLHLSCQEESRSSCGGPPSIDESFAPEPSLREDCGVQCRAGNQRLQRTAGSSGHGPPGLFLLDAEGGVALGRRRL